MNFMTKLLLDIFVLIFLLPLIACPANQFGQDSKTHDVLNQTNNMDGGSDITSELDAGSDEDAGVQDEDAGIGDTCTFNSDCSLNTRCECEDGLCTCEWGTRGSGRSGIDICQNENHCATALCVEGHKNIFYCSGPCQNDNDCGPELPLCEKIAFLGPICIRK
jgi:hypothetical protein